MEGNSALLKSLQLEIELLRKEKDEQIEIHTEQCKVLNEQLGQANNSIEQSETKFRLLIENAFDGVFVLKGHRFNFVNKRFEEITGHTMK